MAEKPGFHIHLCPCGKEWECDRPRCFLDAEPCFYCQIGHPTPAEESWPC